MAPGWASGMVGPGEKNFPFQSKDESSVAGGVAVVGFQPLFMSSVPQKTQLNHWNGGHF